MKQKHLAALLREDITTIRVLFERDVAERQGAEGIRGYIYKVLRTDAASLKEGALVITPPSDKRPYHGIGVVQAIHEEPELDADFEGDYKFIVGVVDKTRYDAIVAHEAEMQKAIVAAEKTIKRKSIVDQYKDALGNTPLGLRFAELARGPKLPAPAAAPTPGTSFDSKE
jgi:hypothetical protein